MLTKFIISYFTYSDLLYCKKIQVQKYKHTTFIFTATCFSNVAVMGSLDVRLSVRNVGDS